MKKIICFISMIAIMLSMTMTAFMSGKLKTDSLPQRKEASHDKQEYSQ